MAELMACPSCTKELQVPDDLIGRDVRCPLCGHTFKALAEKRRASTEQAQLAQSSTFKQSCPSCGWMETVKDSMIGNKVECSRYEDMFLAERPVDEAEQKADHAKAEERFDVDFEVPALDEEAESSDFDLDLDDSEPAEQKKKTSASVPIDAYTGGAPFLFVSYCHRDRDVVYPEIARLHQKGFRIWYDEGIAPGKEWPEEIEDALGRSAFFVVFVSPRAMSSENVRNEINYALRRKKPFLAIHLEETVLVKGMGLQMEARQAIFRYELENSLYIRRLDANLPATLRDA